MRTGYLRGGLLSALIAVATFTVAEAQQNDKSYLPPGAVQSKTAQDAAATPREARGGGIAHRRRRARYAYRRYRRERYAYYNPGFRFPLFLFGLFR